LLGDRRRAGADRGDQLRASGRGAGRGDRLPRGVAGVLLRAEAAQSSARRGVNRRALLLAALLMPTAARAKTKQAKATSSAAQKPAPVKAATPAPPPPIKPGALQPLKEAKTQLVAFNASAFPYRGIIPDTRKPFLDVRAGRRLGHTTLRGDVCWEDTTYS